MNEPQRYAVSGNYAQMIELTDGNYVRWSDYERLKTDLERIRKHRNTLGELLDKAIMDIDRSQFANSEWQPIETAPKDGTPVLIYCQVSGSVEAHWDCEWLDRHNDCCDVYEVTHWMPLPKPPLS